jgi:hypothetical protein
VELCVQHDVEVIVTAAGGEVRIRYLSPEASGTIVGSTMFKVLIDTCVWLDLAKPQHAIPLDLLEDVINVGAASLMVPRIVLDEFARNKSRIAKDGSRNLSDAFKRVKEAVWHMEDGRRRRHLFERLSDLDNKLPTVGDTIVASLARIEELFGRAAIIEASDALRLRAAQRAIDRTAPFHKSKNSMGDAIIIETYGECVRASSARGHRFAFVTHNTSDFSHLGVDERKPHPDLAPLFSRVKSRYFVSMRSLLKTVSPVFVAEMTVEREKREDSRSATEISNAIGELMDKVGYNRMQVLLEQIEEGDVKVVEKETYPRPRGRGRETISQASLVGVRKSIARIERQYGARNLGPWGDFDWGMMSGKLAALRWVFGQEWDDPDLLSL